MFKMKIYKELCQHSRSNIVYIRMGHVYVSGSCNVNEKFLDVRLTLECGEIKKSGAKTNVHHGAMISVD